MLQAQIPIGETIGQQGRWRWTILCFGMGFVLKMKGDGGFRSCREYATTRFKLYIVIIESFMIY